MMSSLLILQFPLLVLPMFIIGLTNFDFNSDFNSPSSYVYLGGFILFFVPFVLRRILSIVWNQHLLNMVLSLAFISGVLLYKPLLLGYWDERSDWQAILALVMLCSSFIASFIVQGHTDADKNSHIVVILLFAALWWINQQYMMIIFLLTALIALAGLGLKLQTNESRAENISTNWLIILAAANWSFIFLDYHIEAVFSLHNVYVMLGILFGSYLHREFSVSTVLIALSGMLNFALAVYYPDWLLHEIHSAILGVWIGTLLQSYAQNYQVHKFSAYLFIGFVLGSAFYKNLSYIIYILIFFIPPIIFMSIQCYRDFSFSHKK